MKEGVGAPPFGSGWRRQDQVGQNQAGQDRLGDVKGDGIGAGLRGEAAGFGVECSREFVPEREVGCQFARLGGGDDGSDGSGRGSEVIDSIFGARPAAA